MTRHLAALPKAHLHVHFDGAVRRSTVLDLADAAGVTPPQVPRTYDSFSDFLTGIDSVAQLLRTAEDAARVVDEIVQDTAAAGGVWVEPSLWPGLFGGRLGPYGEAVDVVLDAGRAAARRHGVGFGLVLAANRDRGPDEAKQVAALASARAGDGVVAFGLDGDESAHPPAWFVEAFAVARAAGLLAVPHAGELAGPESVRDALEHLGAKRIMHGIRAVDDPELRRRLADSATTLDVCPTSNAMLGVVASLDGHPLPRLLAAGVRCSINADDPLFFHTDVLTEYRRCRDVLGLSDEQLADAARTSLQASGAPQSLVRQAMGGIDTWLASTGGTG